MPLPLARTMDHAPGQDPLAEIEKLVLRLELLEDLLGVRVESLDACDPAICRPPSQIEVAGTPHRGGSTRRRFMSLIPTRFISSMPRRNSATLSLRHRPTACVLGEAFGGSSGPRRCRGTSSPARSRFWTHTKRPTPRALLDRDHRCPLGATVLSQYQRKHHAACRDRALSSTSATCCPRRSHRTSPQESLPIAATPSKVSESRRSERSQRRVRVRRSSGLRRGHGDSAGLKHPARKLHQVGGRGLLGRHAASMHQSVHHADADTLLSRRS